MKIVQNNKIPLIKRKRQQSSHNRDLPTDKAYYEYIENMRKLNDEASIT